MGEMAQVYYLENMTYEEVDNLNAETVFILPMGPLEAHGPHLPLGVDINGAVVLTEMAAKILAKKGISIAILPVLPYTLSDAAMPFKGTVTFSEETVIAIILDIARSISQHGFKRLVINCHHLERPNMQAIREAVHKTEELGISVLASNAILDSIPRCHGLLKGEHPEWDFHAGEVETSFYLWQFPHLVKTDKLKNLLPNWSDLRQKFQQGAKDFVEAGGPKCYFGDPAKGTAATGRKIYEIQAQTLAEEILNWIN